MALGEMNRNLENSKGATNIYIRPGDRWEYLGNSYHLVNWIRHGFDQLLGKFARMSFKLFCFENTSC